MHASDGLVFFLGRAQDEGRVILRKGQSCLLVIIFFLETLDDEQGRDIKLSHFLFHNFPLHFLSCYFVGSIL